MVTEDLGGRTREAGLTTICQYLAGDSLMLWVTWNTPSDDWTASVVVLVEN